MEGDSERVVLPKLGEALGLTLDPAFVAVAPLGGRHVQHFWRLLSDLGIPYATLLDLDLGRAGGGWGRIKTAVQNLIDIGVPRAELLETTDGVLSSAEFAEMHEWANSEDHVSLHSWLARLRSHGVFFSKPLDLDLAMLRAFPAAYEAIIPAGGGPRKSGDAAASVLGAGGAGEAAYTGPYAGLPALFPAYRYHFLTRSKPATHIEALSRLNRADMVRAMPTGIKVLLRHLAEKLKGG